MENRHPNWSIFMLLDNHNTNLNIPNKGYKKMSEFNTKMK